VEIVAFFTVLILILLIIIWVKINDYYFTLWISIQIYGKRKLRKILDKSTEEKIKSACSSFLFASRRVFCRDSYTCNCRGVWNEFSPLNYYFPYKEKLSNSSCWKLWPDSLLYSKASINWSDSSLRKARLIGKIPINSTSDKRGHPCYP